MVSRFSLKMDRSDGLILESGEDGDGGGGYEDEYNIKDVAYRFRQVLYRAVCNITYT
jgi:hypothetical protein